jgi:hypothetical protein
MPVTPCVFGASRPQDPRAKAALLSALSPRGRMHLLGVVYARDAANRWQPKVKGSEVGIPQALLWLEPLKNYAESITTVRLICDDGPAKVSACSLPANGDPAGLTCLSGAMAYDQAKLLELAATSSCSTATWLCRFSRCRCSPWTCSGTWTSLNTSARLCKRC